MKWSATNLVSRLKISGVKGYFNQTLSLFLKKEDIVHQSLCTNVPLQNGVAKYKNWHLLEVTWALLFQKNVSKSYWREAMLTVAHLINRLPSRVLGRKSPMFFFLFFEFFPINGVCQLPPRVFLCITFVIFMPTLKQTWSWGSQMCILWGYSAIKRGINVITWPHGNFFCIYGCNICWKPVLFKFLSSSEPLMKDKEDLLFLDLPSNQTTNVEVPYPTDLLLPSLQLIQKFMGRKSVILLPHHHRYASEGSCIAQNWCTSKKLTPKRCWIFFTILVISFSYFWWLELTGCS